MTVSHMKPWIFEEVKRIGRQRFDSPYWPWLDQAIYDATQESVCVLDPQNPATLAGFVLTCPSNSLSANLYPLIFSDWSNPKGQKDSPDTIQERPNTTPQTLSNTLSNTLSGWGETASLENVRYPLNHEPLNAISHTAIEIAFVAVDTAWEGKGLARRMLSEVLLCCKATHQNCWLHVDTYNPRARGLYESLGFYTLFEIPDLYGSHGSLMMWNARPFGLIHPNVSGIALEDSGKFCRDTDMKEWPTLLNTSPCQSKHTLTGGIFTPPLMTSA